MFLKKNTAEGNRWIDNIADTFYASCISHLDIPCFFQYTFLRLVKHFYVTFSKNGLSIYAIVELKFLRLFSVVGLKLVGIGKHGNFHKHVLCYVCIVLAVFLLFAYETEEVILFIVILIICFPFSNSWTKEEIYKKYQSRYGFMDNHWNLTFPSYSRRKSSTIFTIPRFFVWL